MKIRKWMLLMLALVLAVSATPAMGEAAFSFFGMQSEPDTAEAGEAPVGVWEARTMSAQGMTMTLGPDSQMRMVIDLRDDFTYTETTTQDGDAEDYEGTWTWSGDSGTLETEGVILTLRLEDGLLIMEGDVGGGSTGTLTLAPQGAAPAVVTGGGDVEAPAADDPTGQWTLESASYQGMTISIDGMGMSMNFDLKADGTVKASMDYGDDAEDAEGTWSWAGGAGEITIDGDSVPFTMKDGKLVMEGGPMGDGASIILKRPGETARDVATTVETPTAADTDPVGSWTAESASAQGMTITFDGGFMGTIDLEVRADGTFSMAMNAFGENDSENGVWSFSNGVGTMSVDDEPVSFAMQDGKLVLQGEDGITINFKRK